MNSGIWKILKLISHQIVLAVVMIESSEPVSLQYLTQIIYFFLMCQGSIAVQFNYTTNAKNSAQ